MCEKFWTLSVHPVQYLPGARHVRAGFRRVAQGVFQIPLPLLPRKTSDPDSGGNRQDQHPRRAAGYEGIK